MLLCERGSEREQECVKTSESFAIEGSLLFLGYQHFSQVSGNGKTCLITISQDILHYTRPLALSLSILSKFSSHIEADAGFIVTRHIVPLWRAYCAEPYSHFILFQEEIFRAEATGAQSPSYLSRGLCEGESKVEPCVN